MLDVKGVLSPVISACHRPSAKEGNFQVSECWKKNPTLSLVAVFFLLGDYPAFEYYVPKFWNTLFHLHGLTCIYTLAISSRLFFLLLPPMKMERTWCSETSAYKFQMSGNHPKERIQRSEHGESCKSRTICRTFY